MVRMKEKYQLVFDQCHTFQKITTTQAMENFRKYPYELYYFCNDPQLTKVALLERATKTKDSIVPHTSSDSKRGSPHSLTQLKNIAECTSAFRPGLLLSLLKDKSLGIYGDSLSRQLFNGIIGGTLHRSDSYYRPERIYINHYYRDYNANISYCEDGFGHMAVRQQKDKDFRSCLQPMLDTVDYLIIGISAWFKPYFSVSPEKVRDYYDNLRVSQILYAKYMEAVRQRIVDYATRVRSASPPKIIWRLSPHAGNIDEMNFLYPNLSKDYDHWNGHLWSYNFTTQTAGWVLTYNEILRNISRSYGDHVFDWYSLSIYYLEFTVSARIASKIHFDSLHYCLEGLPLASNLLVANLIRNLQLQK